MRAKLSPAASASAARQAGLRYVSDDSPGIRRKPTAKKGFVYHMPGSRRVPEKYLGRIRHLAIPPAWTDVWICPIENGHIQATGRDARGRKQYRYHPRWRETRDEAKFDRVLAFGEALPRIRRHMTADLKRRGLDRRKVMATIVRLLETTLIRVGNDEYAQQNDSYGLTTMHNRHAQVCGGQIVFEFKGKSGKRHRIDVRDARLAKLVRRCQELPGQDLFGYVDDEGIVHDVTSGDVNDYLRAIAGDDFSAKDFRTWAGTVTAANTLHHIGSFSSQRQAKRNILRTMEAVAEVLGNTPVICRRCYVHPAVLDGYLAGHFSAAAHKSGTRQMREAINKLRSDEAAVMGLIRKHRMSANRNHARRKQPRLDKS